MTDSISVTLATLALILLSAFFVIIEFALMGARRHRLEELAPHSSSARAALRGMNDLTLMLAGAQLGITVCTFALGAITKPAVDSFLGPIFLEWGMPYLVADSASFLLSMFFVTFLHLVAGEMAPKSWAIAHPEKSALAIGTISRAYIWPLRPMLIWINRIANRLVRAVGVEPVESAAVGGQDIATIRQLVDHSADVGALEPVVHQQLSGLIDLGSKPVASLLASSQVTSVDATASIADVRDAASISGHMRIIMANPRQPMVVHLRDTLLKDDDAPAASVARAAFVLHAETPIYEAMANMRAASVQLAVVTRGDKISGFITLADILQRILPEGSGEKARPGAMATS